MKKTDALLLFTTTSFKRFYDNQSMLEQNLHFLIKSKLENLPVDTVETVGEFSFWFCPRMTFEDEIPLTFSILGSDQGLLNTFFKDWSTNLSKRLPYTYNMVSSASYTYAPAVN